MALHSRGKVRLDRPLEGKISSCTIKREVDEWYAVILSTQEIPDPLPSTKPAVGIDRGVVCALADSDGRLVKNPRYSQALQDRIARAQRSLSRKLKGSRNSKKARMKLARLKQHEARQRAHFLHQESRYYVDNYGFVAMENLNIKGMTKGAQGTKEEPGKKVRQKAGLNRSILSVGWGMFGEMVRYKGAWTGVQVVQGPAHHTSQECPECGYTDAKNRLSQAHFRCMKCGYEANADHAAARNILRRGLSIAQVPTETKPGVTIKIKGRRKKAGDAAEKSSVKRPVEDSPQ